MTVTGGEELKVTGTMVMTISPPEEVAEGSLSSVVDCTVMLAKVDAPD